MEDMYFTPHSLCREKLPVSPGPNQVLAGGGDTIRAALGQHWGGIKWEKSSSLPPLGTDGATAFPIWLDFLGALGTGCRSWRWVQSPSWPQLKQTLVRPMRAKGLSGVNLQLWSELQDIRLTLEVVLNIRLFSEDTVGYMWTPWSVVLRLTFLFVWGGKGGINFIFMLSMSLLTSVALLVRDCVSFFFTSPQCLT